MFEHEFPYSKSKLFKYTNLKVESENTALLNNGFTSLSSIKLTRVIKKKPRLTMKKTFHQVFDTMDLTQGQH